MSGEAAEHALRELVEALRDAMADGWRPADIKRVLAALQTADLVLAEQLALPEGEES